MDVTAKADRSPSARRRWPRLRPSGQRHRQPAPRRRGAARARQPASSSTTALPPDAAASCRRGPSCRSTSSGCDASRTSAPAARRSSSPASCRPPGPATRSRRSCWACCSASCSASAWRSCASRPTAGCAATEQVTAAFDAPVLTTVPRSRALKRHKPFADLPARGGRGIPNAADEPALRPRRAGAQRAGHLVAQPRGQDDDLLEPRLGRGLGGLSVALVEADLRRPSLAERYGLEQAPGLAEASRARCRSPTAMQTILPVRAAPNRRPPAPAARDRRRAGRRPTRGR